MACHLHIDPFSGIAGDMFLGALIDLGVTLDQIMAALAPLRLNDEATLSADRVQRCGIQAVNFGVNAPAVHGKHVHYHDMLRLVDRLDVAERAKQRAKKVVDLLAHAEARVHGVSVEKVHFHEVGAIDSIVDMLGAAIGVELLGVDTMSCGPLPISRGTVRCAHGVFPVPAPATMYLMEGRPTVGVDREGELVTPTGAAIIAAMCDQYGPPPPLIVRGIGYGAGDREHPEIPNVLRLILGERINNPQKHTHTHNDHHYSHTQH